MCGAENSPGPDRPEPWRYVGGPDDVSRPRVADPQASTWEDAPGRDAEVGRLGRLRSADDDLGRTLQSTVDAALDALSGVDAVSITLYENGVAGSVAVSGPLAAALDERQYHVRSGPCLAAARHGRSTTVRSTAEGGDDAGFAEFARLARLLGVTSATALPLVGWRGVRGALNTYTCDGGPLAGADLARAEAVAAGAAHAVEVVGTHAAALEEVTNLRAAMVSRAVIEQAKGVIMLREDLGADDAFAELRRMSQAGNRKVRDIAEDVVRDLGRRGGGQGA